MIGPDVIHSRVNAMVETTRARETIERARETIERAREGARALVDALARDDDAMMRSNDDDSIDDDDARRRAMERIVKRCAADARFVDAAVRAVRRETSTIGKVETCLLYTSPSPRDGLLSRMPSSA